MAGMVNTQPSQHGNEPPSLQPGRASPLVEDSRRQAPTSQQRDGEMNETGVEGP